MTSGGHFYFAVAERARGRFPMKYPIFYSVILIYAAGEKVLALNYKDRHTVGTCGGR